MCGLFWSSSAWLPQNLETKTLQRYVNCHRLLSSCVFPACKRALLILLVSPSSRVSLKNPTVTSMRHRSYTKTS